MFSSDGENMFNESRTWIQGAPAVWLGIKTFSLLFIYVWIRATLPRLRYDQLMELGWKRLIPISLIWLILSSIVLGVREFGLPWS